MVPKPPKALIPDGIAPIIVKHLGPEADRLPHS